MSSDGEIEEVDNNLEGRYSEFEEFFSSLDSDKRVAIVLQHTPDPDAIGSALGLEWLLEVQFGLLCDVFYSGQVSHPQNQTEINVLDIQLDRTEDLDEEKYSTFVSVDSVPQNTGLDIPVDEWGAVFDHHQFDLTEPELVDIRTVGACASMMWDYLNQYDMDYTSDRGVTVASALLFGIINDTDHLLTENVCDLDVEAHSHLIQYRDRKKFNSIVNYPLPPYLFRLESKAADNMVKEASNLISSLGIISDKRRDALPIIADKFLRMEGIETAVVFAMIGDHIHASVRSRNSSVNVPNFCQRVFGPTYGGGKHGSGGAKVPIGFLYSPEDDDDLKQKVCDLAQEMITKRIIRYLSGA